MINPSPPDAKSYDANAWVQLLAACLTGILIPLCFTGPAVVLPSISLVLGGSTTELGYQWLYLDLWQYHDGSRKHDRHVWAQADLATGTDTLFSGDIYYPFRPICRMD